MPENNILPDYFELRNNGTLTENLADTYLDTKGQNFNFSSEDTYWEKYGPAYLEIKKDIPEEEARKAFSQEYSLLKDEHEKYTKQSFNLRSANNTYIVPEGMAPLMFGLKGVETNTGWSEFTRVNPTKGGGTMTPTGFTDHLIDDRAFAKEHTSFQGADGKIHRFNDSEDLLGVIDNPDFTNAQGKRIKGFQYNAQEALYSRGWDDEDLPVTFKPVYVGEVQDPTLEWAAEIDLGTGILSTTPSLFSSRGDVIKAVTLALPKAVGTVIGGGNDVLRALTTHFDNDSFEMWSTRYRNYYAGGRSREAQENVWSAENVAGLTADIAAQILIARGAGIGTSVLAKSLTSASAAATAGGITSTTAMALMAGSGAMDAALEAGYSEKSAAAYQIVQTAVSFGIARTFNWYADSRTTKALAAEIRASQKAALTNAAYVGQNMPGQVVQAQASKLATNWKNSLEKLRKADSKTAFVLKSGAEEAIEENVEYTLEKSINDTFNIMTDLGIIKEGKFKSWQDEGYWEDVTTNVFMNTGAGALGSIGTSFFMKNHRPADYVNTVAKVAAQGEGKMYLEILQEQHKKGLLGSTVLSMEKGTDGKWLTIEEAKKINPNALSHNDFNHKALGNEFIYIDSIVKSIGGGTNLNKLIEENPDLKALFDSTDFHADYKNTHGRLTNAIIEIQATEQGQVFSATDIPLYPTGDMLKTPQENSRLVEEYEEKMAALESNFGIDLKVAEQLSKDKTELNKYNTREKIVELFEEFLIKKNGLRKTVDGKTVELTPEEVKVERLKFNALQKLTKNINTIGEKEGAFLLEQDAELLAILSEGKLDPEQLVEKIMASRGLKNTTKEKLIKKLLESKVDSLPAFLALFNEVSINSAFERRAGMFSDPNSELTKLAAEVYATQDAGLIKQFEEKIETGIKALIIARHKAELGPGSENDESSMPIITADTTVELEQLFITDNTKGLSVEERVNKLATQDPNAALGNLNLYEGSKLASNTNTRIQEVLGIFKNNTNIDALLNHIKTIKDADTYAAELKSKNFYEAFSWSFSTGSDNLPTGLGGKKIEDLLSEIEADLANKDLDTRSKLERTIRLNNLYAQFNAREAQVLLIGNILDSFGVFQYKLDAFEADLDFTKKKEKDTFAKILEQDYAHEKDLKYIIDYSKIIEKVIFNPVLFSRLKAKREGKFLPETGSIQEILRTLNPRLKAYRDRLKAERGLHTWKPRLLSGILDKVLPTPVEGQSYLSTEEETLYQEMLAKESLLDSLFHDKNVTIEGKEVLQKSKFTELRDRFKKALAESDAYMKELEEAMVHGKLSRENLTRQNVLIEEIYGGLEDLETTSILTEKDKNILKELKADLDNFRRKSYDKSTVGKLTNEEVISSYKSLYAIKGKFFTLSKEAKEALLASRDKDKDIFYSTAALLPENGWALQSDYQMALVNTLYADEEFLFSLVKEKLQAEEEARAKELMTVDQEIAIIYAMSNALYGTAKRFKEIGDKVSDKKVDYPDLGYLTFIPGIAGSGKTALTHSIYTMLTAHYAAQTPAGKKFTSWLSAVDSTKINNLKDAIKGEAEDVLVTNLADKLEKQIIAESNGLAADMPTMLFIDEITLIEYRSKGASSRTSLNTIHDLVAKLNIGRQKKNLPKLTIIGTGDPAQNGFEEGGKEFAIAFRDNSFTAPYLSYSHRSTISVNAIYAANILKKIGIGTQQNNINDLPASEYGKLANEDDKDYFGGVQYTKPEDESEMLAYASHLESLFADATKSKFSLLAIGDLTDFHPAIQKVLGKNASRVEIMTNIVAAQGREADYTLVAIKTADVGDSYDPGSELANLKKLNTIITRARRFTFAINLSGRTLLSKEANAGTVKSIDIATKEGLVSNERIVRIESLPEGVAKESTLEAAPVEDTTSTTDTTTDIQDTTTDPQEVITDDVWALFESGSDIEESILKDIADKLSTGTPLSAREQKIRTAFPAKIEIFLQDKMFSQMDPNSLKTFELEGVNYYLYENHILEMGPNNRLVLIRDEDRRADINNAYIASQTPATTDPTPEEIAKTDLEAAKLALDKNNIKVLTGEELIEWAEKINTAFVNAPNKTYKKEYKNLASKINKETERRAAASAKAAIIELNERAEKILRLAVDHKFTDPDGLLDVWLEDYALMEIADPITAEYKEKLEALVEKIAAYKEHLYNSEDYTTFETAADLVTETLVEDIDNKDTAKEKAIQLEREYNLLLAYTSKGNGEPVDVTFKSLIENHIQVHRDFTGYTHNNSLIPVALGLAGKNTKDFTYHVITRSGEGYLYVEFLAKHKTKKEFTIIGSLPISAMKEAGSMTPEEITAVLTPNYIGSTHIFPIDFVILKDSIASGALRRGKNKLSLTEALEYLQGSLGTDFPVVISDKIYIDTRPNSKLRGDAFILYTFDQTKQINSAVVENLLAKYGAQPGKFSTFEGIGIIRLDTKLQSLTSVYNIFLDIHKKKGKIFPYLETIAAQGDQQHFCRIFAELQQRLGGTIKPEWNQLLGQGPSIFLPGSTQDTSGLSVLLDNTVNDPNVMSVSYKEDSTVPYYRFNILRFFEKLEASKGTDTELDAALAQLDAILSTTTKFPNGFRFKWAAKLDQNTNRNFAVLDPLNTTTDNDFGLQLVKDNLEITVDSIVTPAVRINKGALLEALIDVENKAYPVIFTPEPYTDAVQIKIKAWLADPENAEIIDNAGDDAVELVNLIKAAIFKRGDKIPANFTDFAYRYIKESNPFEAEFSSFVFDSTGANDLIIASGSPLITQKDITTLEDFLITDNSLVSPGANPFTENTLSWFLIERAKAYSNNDLYRMKYYEQVIRANYLGERAGKLAVLTEELLPALNPQQEEIYTKAQEVECSGLTAKDGLSISFTPGQTWEVVTNFKGNSHAEGGIDIEISEGKVRMKKGTTPYKAKYGLVLNKNYVTI